QASLLNQALTASWLMAIAVIVVGAVVILLFVYRDVEYSNQLWCQFEFTAEAPRGLRAVLGITIISTASTSASSVACSGRKLAGR
ncbi:hypothetical protein ACC771_21465, partial [Rhizobium ruizarguesonis]